MSTIKKRGNMIYIIKGIQFTNKIILNQITNRWSYNTDSAPPKEKEVTDVILILLIYQYRKGPRNNAVLIGKGK